MIPIRPAKSRGLNKATGSFRGIREMNTPFLTGFTGDGLMKKIRVLLMVLVTGFVLTGCAGKGHRADYDYRGPYDDWAAVDPIRIVVLPFYTEEGDDAGDGGDSTLHYRRMMGYISNQLVRHNFEVINPFAYEASQREYNRIMERSREDSALAASDMCRKYGVDAVFITWLKVKYDWKGPEKCKAKATVYGEGYDSGGNALGVSISRGFKITRGDCEDAIADAEVEIGDEIGRKISAWGKRYYYPSAPRGEGGALKRGIDKNRNYINIRLDGATDYEVVEAFGKVVKTARGVKYAKNYSQRIMPGDPQASYVTWRATVYGTDTFVLQANIMKMVHDVCESGGTVMLKGVPYRYTPAEIDMLKGVRPGDATSREIQFVVDRGLARDREMSGRYDPYPRQPMPVIEPVETGSQFE